MDRFSRTSVSLLFLSSFALFASVSHADEKESWVGKQVMPKRAGFQYPRIDSDGKEIGSVYVPSLVVTVVGQEGKKINLRMDGVEWWSAKEEAIPVEDAVLYFTEQIRTNPKDARAYAYRAVARRLTGELDLALMDLDEAMRLTPGTAWLHNLRGIAWEKKKDFDRAMKDFDEAIRLYPSCYAFFMNRSNIWSSKGDYVKALKDLDEAIRLDPMNPRVYSNRGNIYEKMKDFGKALKDHDEAIRLDPKHGSLYANRGNIHVRKKDYDRAMEDYTLAVQFGPTSALGWNNLAWLLATCPKDSVRNGKKAVEYGTKACELSKYKNANDIGTLAGAYAEIGDFKEAVKWEKRALEVGYNTPPETRLARMRLKLYEEGKPYREE